MGWILPSSAPANEEFAPVPDAVVWLDIPVSVALERIGSRGERDAFETEAGLTACRNVFASIHEPWMLRVDADAGKEEVAARVRKALSGNFPEVIVNRRIPLAGGREFSLNI